MSMIFAAGDPGGSRALLPVLHELEQQGQHCVVLEHGFLARELPSSSKAEVCPQEDIAGYLSGNAVYLFGSSTTDTLPLALARLAHKRHIPTIHVLDSWGTYRSRLCTDGQKPFVPDIYTVLDEAARQGAIAEGVPESCLMITGHPGLADAVTSLRHLTDSPKPALAKKYGLPADKICVAFINEPFAAVYGTDCSTHGHPGFTEQTVLPDFLGTLEPFGKELFVLLLAHPKQQPEEIAAFWEASCRSLAGKVIALPTGREILHMVSGVAGMASILLYESWLAGLPTLALQPGRRTQTTPRYASLDGLLYTDQRQNTVQQIAAWLAKVQERKVPVARPELKLHEEAPRNIAELAFRLQEETR